MSLTKPSLCIVNFNGANVLTASLSVAYALRHRFTELLVVDNGSTDGSAATVERDFPGVKAVMLPDNLGAGGARNVGLRRAASDLILFIDNDVALTEECVNRLMDAMAQHPRAALAAASVVYADTRDIVQYDGAECHSLGLQTLLDENVPVSEIAHTVRKVGSIVTCCFLADRTRLPPNETFDESFFYIFEDHDFGVRVRALGAEVLSVPHAFCYHGKGTEGLSIRQLGSYSSKRVYYVIRNRWLVILKNFSSRTLLVMAPLFLLYEVSQLVLAIKKGWFREWWQALVWTVRHLRPIWRERRRIQRRRIVPDRHILIGGRIPFRHELSTTSVERLARGLLDAAAVSYWKLAGRLI